MSMVVYIDDEPLLCKAVRTLLASSAISVETFTEPAAALAFIAAHPVELVICDYRMPQMDGLDVFSQLPRPTPFYLVSGELEIPQPPGLLGVLQKPFSLDRLLEIVRRHLGTPLP